MPPLSTLRGKENRLPAMLRAQGKASGGSGSVQDPRRQAVGHRQDLGIQLNGARRLNRSRNELHAADAAQPPSEPGSTTRSSPRRPGSGGSVFGHHVALSGFEPLLTEARRD